MRETKYGNLDLGEVNVLVEYHMDVIHTLADSIRQTRSIKRLDDIVEKTEVIKSSVNRIKAFLAEQQYMEGNNENTESNQVDSPTV